MNTIIQSPLASDPSRQQPFPVPSLLFLETSQLETFNNAILGLLPSYNSANPYVLFGCVRSGTADAGSGSTTVTAGAIFWQGEIYTVPTATVTLASNYLVGKITVTNGSPDPILLKDGTSTNVHNVRQIVWSAGTSGSGDFNQASCVAKRLKYLLYHDANIAGGSVFNTSTYTNFDNSLKFTTPNDGITRTWRIIFKAFAQTISVPTAQTCLTSIALYAGGGSGTQLDFTSVGQLRVAGSTSDYYWRDSVNLIWEGSLAPNTVVSIMGLNYSGSDPVDFANNKLIAEEV